MGLLVKQQTNKLEWFISLFDDAESGHSAIGTKFCSYGWAKGAARIERDNIPMDSTFTINALIRLE